ETKKGHVVRFLNQRAKVKVTIMFRGRETTHPERGRDLLLRLAEDVKEIGQIESQPLLDGRNMVMVLGPTKAAGEKKIDEEAPAATAALQDEVAEALAAAAPEEPKEEPKAAEPEAKQEPEPEAKPAPKTEAKAAAKPKKEKTEATAAAEPEPVSEGS
ncbi:MAG: translation initiation factor, partial [Gaiellaceae bacterium]|nr:translation initiation factor [Gaiellaceae bacterium]